MATIELVPLEQPDPAPYNPRKISEQRLDGFARFFRTWSNGSGGLALATDLEMAGRGSSSRLA
ncbi:MAG: hypothetical protein Kow00129_13720 [Thermoleophilia bacterium]